MLPAELPFALDDLSDEGDSGILEQPDLEEDYETVND